MLGDPEPRPKPVKRVKPEVVNKKGKAKAEAEVDEVRIARCSLSLAYPLHESHSPGGAQPTHLGTQPFPLLWLCTLHNQGLTVHEGRQATVVIQSVNVPLLCHFTCPFPQDASDSDQDTEADSELLANPKRFGRGACLVMSACHSLVTVNDELVGDPLEKAALEVRCRLGTLRTRN